MPIIACRGYCGGHFPRDEMSQVGRSGEMFCRACAQRARRSRRE